MHHGYTQDYNLKTNTGYIPPDIRKTAPEPGSPEEDYTGNAQLATGFIRR